MTTPGRSCGSCSLCCKLLGIASIDKPVGRWCGHFKPGAGCAVYAGRPHECIAFNCEWLAHGGWGAEWKPDKARFVMMTENDGKRLRVIVDPDFPEAWRREPYYSSLKHISKAAADGVRVFVVIGLRHIVVFPDRDHDLGPVPEDARIESGMRRTPAGLASYARVMTVAG